LLLELDEAGARKKDTGITQAVKKDNTI